MPTCQAVLLLVVVVEERGVRTVLNLLKVDVGADTSTAGGTVQPC